MSCHECGDVRAAEFYHVDGIAACPACKEKLVAQAIPLRDWAPTVRALGFGLVAALAGAMLYYAVITITNVEIGFVAIVVGYMVGWSIRRGAGGRGGRRLQVAAMGLTYLAIAMAYLPLAMEGAAEADAEEYVMVSGNGAQSGADYVLVAGDAVVAQQGDVMPVLPPADTGEQLGGVQSAIILAGIVLALPLLMIVGSLPSGLISALIIAFGMYQAWRMTGVTELIVTGPVGKQLQEDATS